MDQALRGRAGQILSDLKVWCCRYQYKTKTNLLRLSIDWIKKNKRKAHEDQANTTINKEGNMKMVILYYIARLTLKL